MTGGDLVTKEEVRRVLKTPYKPLALAALSYVNLSDRELDLLILRYLRRHTQEEVADEMGYSSRIIQRWEGDALNKCAAAWKNLLFIQEILRSAQ